MLSRTTVRRLLRPQRGAVANARDAVALHQAAAADRRELARLHAEAAGTGSWYPLSSSGGEPHAVHLAVDDCDLVSALSSFVAEGLAEGEVCLVVATASHRDGLATRLALAGLAEEARRLLVQLDAVSVLQGLLRDGRLDPRRFDSSLGRAVRAAAGRGTGLRAFGEMVGLLYGRGELVAALELERLWTALQRDRSFSLLCAYPSGLHGDAEAQQQVGAAHTHVSRLPA